MIEVISGTNRAGAMTPKVARLIVKKYVEEGAEAQLMDLAELPTGIFHPDAYGEKPAGFAAWQQRILDADGLHVVVPEYNGSFPGALKLFVDMLKFPESFEHKCVAYTGIAAGIWGGLRAVEQLQLVFGYRNAYNAPERVWIPGIQNHLNEDGNAFTNDTTDRRLSAQVRDFLKFVARNKDAGECETAQVR